MNTPKENIEMFKDMASESYDVARELADINLRAWNKMLEKQMDMMNIWIEASVKQVELSSTIKDQKEYMTSQAVLTRDLGEKLIDSGRKAISAGNDMQSEYRAWYEKSVQSMTKNWNKAGKQAS
jgi:hypothetical protein